MSANPQVKIAVLNFPEEPKYIYSTTTPQTLVADAVKLIGCNPLNLTSRVISQTSSHRLSMLFSFEESLPIVDLQIPQTILDASELSVCYDGYRVCGVENVDK